MITRRWMLQGTGALLTGLGMGVPRAHAGGIGTLGATLAEIEAASGGRLGVAVFDTDSGSRSGHRAGERFPICSTYKLLAAAAVLDRIDHGRERLDRRIRYKPSQVLPNSPAAQGHGETGMTLAELCEAAVAYSDNTAGNLLLDAIGGPAGLTAYVRTLGDQATRLDHIEPALNETVPGDPRDSTTPGAMLADLQHLILGDALKVPSRGLLTGWLLGSRTGNARLRAGLPAAWRVGDKTGTGSRGATADVAVVWPGDRPAIVVTAYLAESDTPPTRRDATLAAVGRAVAAAIG